ncbi:MAG: hypothetical protein CVU21_01765 [Betaproteobacteria bacterium HGW-Betaproteobacteria-15]|nr:MAG: hypothetical protein CVU21_01765 [Betaproteobacteria bacterium HGW-Betaproteobacteria-15]
MLFTVLHALATLGAIGVWTMAMYFWYLRNFSSKPGAKDQGKGVVLFFAAALVCTVAAWALRAEFVSGP